MDNPFEGQKAALASLSGAYKLGIHSGKGGVGKTFLSVNLAYSLAARGCRVGLLDADIDCPNVSKFLSIQGMAAREKGALVPAMHEGVAVISTALLNPGSESPIIIRGPIKHNMLLSFLSSVRWGALDYLVIDLPPGTADVPLSAMQLAALDGLMLVSAPTKESLLDTARAANMARKLGVGILGLVENMSGDIFGSRGEEAAARMEVPFLGSIPLSAETARINEEAGIAFLRSEALYGIRDSLLGKVAAARGKPCTSS
jgi:ATP-binding protein involved in chromosome partitioning